MKRRRIHIYPIFTSASATQRRLIMTLTAIVMAFDCGCLQASRQRVVDSESGAALPRVSVFDRYGKIIGTCNDDGILPDLTGAAFPLTLRSLGYKDKSMASGTEPEITMTKATIILPEITVSTKRRPILHMTGFLREISTLCSYGDTITLYREKWIDFMLPAGNEKKFKARTAPRVLKSQSYYRFTDCTGLDSVSDRTDHHFSWSDWIALPPRANLPYEIAGNREGQEKRMGKYIPKETWTRDSNQVHVDINVLADTTARAWVPRIASFFKRDDMEFQTMIVKCDYSDIDTFAVKPQNLDRMACYIESDGRGHSMFRFNRKDEPFFVSTYTDLNIVDKEWITVKDAKRMEKDPALAFDPLILPRAASIMTRDESTADLVARVESINHDLVRLRIKPDPRLGSLTITPPPTTRKEKIKHALKSVLNAISH